VNIAELKRKSVPELFEMAEGFDVENPGGLRKQDLIFRIEQKLLDQNVTLTGEGVLEILPEGYGFLRSQDWNYLYGPDDIYVSPSQIKRFDLKTGDTVSGQVRPPKEWERYLALLKVESVNGDDPDVAKQRIPFDNLRPRYPEGRLRLETRDGDLSMRIMDLIAPDRERTAWPHRLTAARRKDNSSPEDCERDSREPAGGHAHRSSDR
jgi:transcription termination factor Rho